MRAPNPIQLYGAYGLWAVIAPERFGFEPMPSHEMVKASNRASEELRQMFHEKPLKPWKARVGKSGLEVRRISRRGIIAPHPIDQRGP